MKGVFFQSAEFKQARRRQMVQTLRPIQGTEAEPLILTYLGWSEDSMNLSMTSRSNHQRVRLYLNKLPAMFAHMSTLAFLWKFTDFPLLTRQYLGSYYFQKVFYPNHPELHGNMKLFAHLVQLIELVDRLNARRDLYSNKLIGYLENQIRFGRLSPKIYENLSGESPEICIPAGIDFKTFNRQSRLIWSTFCDEAELKDLTDSQWAVLKLGVELKDILKISPHQCTQLSNDWGRRPLGLVESCDDARLLKLDIQQKSLIKQLRRTY